MARRRLKSSGILDVRDFRLDPSGAHYTEALSAPSFRARTMKASISCALPQHPQGIAIGGTNTAAPRASSRLTYLEEIISDVPCHMPTPLYIEAIA